MSASTIVESSVWKPGNTTPTQRAHNVSFTDLLSSAAITRKFYVMSCEGRRPTFQNLRLAVLETKSLGLDYAIFGTAMTLMPLSSAKIEGIEDLDKATELLKTMGDDETYQFIGALREVSPSYLGTMKRWDYRGYAGGTWDLLIASANFDSVCRNMVNGYKYTKLAYREIERAKDLAEGILMGFLKVLSEVPDGLILRRHGARAALWASETARKILRSMDGNALNDFNNILLQRRWNPGSTADIVASAVYLYLVEK